MHFSNKYSAKKIMNRRSLTQAINVEAPDIRDFLKAGLPAPKAAPAPEPERPEPAAAVAEPPAVSETSSVRTKPKPKPDEEPVREEPSIPVTFRLPESLVRAMISASAERKIRRIKPSTQQDIAALAIREWLNRNNYL
ncbi:hypothetical protein EON80_11410 [bacterium]|nr:MAG: hypothetical protein EON80_11410 [bacterium]